MPKIKLLVVEDDDLMLNMLRDNLTREGYEVTGATDGLQALAKFKEGGFDLVLMDIKLPKMDGVTLLKRIKNTVSDVPCIMMTAYGTVETAVSAMKLGAFDYIGKPFLFEELSQIIKNALELSSLRKENLLLKERLGERNSLNNIVGKNPLMQKIYKTIEIASPGNTTIMIEGESGTGKELIADAIHALSERKFGPLVKVNCSALPETLLESELFGHEKGAFSDAVKMRIGRFELANKGTIFLDDIDDLSPAVQVKLLRVLQEREFERVGSSETLKADVRVISATKTDLKKKILEGTFREDLYYRLNVVLVKLPALRERPSDIPLLVNHFLAYYNKNTKKAVKISPEAMLLLIKYAWPGNVRELENLIESMVCLSEKETITPDLLPEHFRKKDAWKAVSLKKALRETEKEHIIRALEHSAGVKKKAAEILGITPKTLWEKIKDFDIE